jgi:hypothetical protein
MAKEESGERAVPGVGEERTAVPQPRHRSRTAENARTIIESIALALLGVIVARLIEVTTGSTISAGAMGGVAAGLGALAFLRVKKRRAGASR